MARFTKRAATSTPSCTITPIRCSPSGSRAARSRPWCTLKLNAEVQLQAMAIGTQQGLSDREVELSRATQFSPLALDRAWEYFCVRAVVDPI